MILQALAHYYERCGDAVAPPGWEAKEIPFLIVLDTEGKPVGINDTREERDGKKRAKEFVVPQSVKRTSGKAANLLWDKPEYALAFSTEANSADAEEKHRLFIERIEALALAELPEIAAVLKFLRRPEKIGLLQHHPEWREICETASAAFLSFKIAGQPDPVFRHPAVVTKISLLNENPDPAAPRGICLVTGNWDVVERLHPSIKGVRDAQSSGANIVSFNADSFCSYGKKQGANSPVGKAAAFAYTTALNTLLGKDSRQKIQVADATTVFWSEKPTRLETDFLLFFSEPAKDDPNRGTKAVKALFESPRTGAWIEPDGMVHFHVLGLAPADSRLAVRFWITGTVADMAANIRQHFEDIAIAHAPHEADHLWLSLLLKQTAVINKTENIPRNLSSEVMRAILGGTRYPPTILATLLRRAGAEHAVPYPRAAFIKACVNRINRTDPYSKEKELTVSLDKANTNPGYLLGRLFAALERAQYLANGAATIAERYYGAASSAPVTVFGTLMRLSRHHLAKIDSVGARVNLEKLFGEILGGLADFPPILSLADQGRFAIGYYHQNQEFFTRKDAGGKSPDGE